MNLYKVKVEVKSYLMTGLKVIGFYFLIYILAPVLDDCFTAGMWFRRMAARLRIVFSKGTLFWFGVLAIGIFIAWPVELCLKALKGVLKMGTDLFYRGKHRKRSAVLETLGLIIVFPRELFIGMQDRIRKRNRRVMTAQFSYSPTGY